LVEKFGLEQTEKTEHNPKFKQLAEWELVPNTDDRYAKVCAWLIAQSVPLEKLEAFQKDKKVRFDEKDFDHLRNLIWYREELIKGKDGAFDLKSILSQSDTRPEEKQLWEVVAKTMK